MALKEDWGPVMGSLCFRTDAEAKLGELLKEDEHRGGKSDRSPRGGSSIPLPPNITKKLLALQVSVR